MKEVNKAQKADGENEPKETQSQIKFNQYLEDLRRNKYVVADVKKIREALEKRDKDGRDMNNELYGDEPLEAIIALNKAVRSMLKKTKGGMREMYLELSKKYALSYYVVLGLVYDFYVHDGLVGVGWGTDFCGINDNYEEYFDNTDIRQPFEFDIVKQTRMMSFPVSIDLHRFVSKRDVLDFIEKRWNIIEGLLAKSRSKKKRFRQRKIDQKLIDFIWEKRDLSLKEISTEVKKEFPQSRLMYFEVGKILSIERQRRLGKLA